MSEQQKQKKKRVNNKAECDTIKIFYLKINPYVVFSFGGLSSVKGTAAQLFMQTTREPKQLPASFGDIRRNEK